MVTTLLPMARIVPKGPSGSVYGIAENFGRELCEGKETMKRDSSAARPDPEIGKADLREGQGIGTLHLRMTSCSKGGKRD
jgi:hypothetical protein